MTRKKFLSFTVIGVLALIFIFLFSFNQKDKMNSGNEFTEYADETLLANADAVYPGSVYSESLRVPLQGAIVIANGQKFIADKKGAWAVPEIKSGTNITVLAYGYSPYQGVFNPDEPIMLNSLPAVEISARVYDEDGKMVNDVFVIALDSNTKEPREILRPEQVGTATFKNTPIGDTILLAIKKGYHLGWSISRIDEKHKIVSILLKKRIPLDQPKQVPVDELSQRNRPWKLPFIEVVHAQDAGEEFEQAFPDEYRLMIERDENAATVEGIELSPDDVADELEKDPNKKDWKSLGAEHLQFSDEIPEGYSLQRKIVDGKEVFVVESDIYTDSVQQKMFGMGVDYGELSVEAQARKKVQAEMGGRPGFQLSLFWHWEKKLSVEYATGLYDTTEDPVNNPLSPVMEEGGMTRPATLYDADGNIVTTSDVNEEFLNAAEKIYEGNPQFSLLVNGSKEPTVVVGEPFVIEANVILNHEPFSGWYILSPAAIYGYFQSRWIDNPAQKFRGPGKITPYLTQNAPPRHTQFSKTHTERKQFTCLDLGEEIVTYSFQVSYRFAPKLLDPRGFVQPGTSHYTYKIPITIRCVGPELMSRKAPDQCGNPATAVISGRVGGQHMDILENVEVYMTKDGDGDVGSVYGSIDGSGAFQVSTSLSPGFYYYWVFGHTTSGHVYLLDEFEGTIEIKEKEEGKEGCDDEEKGEPILDVPTKTPPQSGETSGCGGGSGGGGVLWVCPR